VRASMTPRTPPCSCGFGLVALEAIPNPFPTATQLTHGARDCSMIHLKGA
jgi:hypothetical protein